MTLMPRKRRRTSADAEDLLEFAARKVRNDQRLKSAFEAIYEKYSRDFSGIADEIDLQTGDIVVDNGHLLNLDVDSEDEGEAEEEDNFRKISLPDHLLDQADLTEEISDLDSTGQDGLVEEASDGDFAESQAKNQESVTDEYQTRTLRSGLFLRNNLDDFYRTKPELPSRPDISADFPEETLKRDGERKSRATWTPQESELILKLRRSGMRWDQVALYFPGRGVRGLRLHMHHLKKRATLGRSAGRPDIVIRQRNMTPWTTEEFTSLVILKNRGFKFSNMISFFQNRPLAALRDKFRIVKRRPELIPKAYRKMLKGDAEEHGETINGDPTEDEPDVPFDEAILAPLLNVKLAERNCRFTEEEDKLIAEKMSQGLGADEITTWIPNRELYQIRRRCAELRLQNESQSPRQVKKGQIDELLKMCANGGLPIKRPGRPRGKTSEQTEKYNKSEWISDDDRALAEPDQGRACDDALPLESEELVDSAVDHTFEKPRLVGVVIDHAPKSFQNLPSLEHSNLRLHRASSVTHPIGPWRRSKRRQKPPDEIQGGDGSPVNKDLQSLHQVEDSDSPSEQLVHEASGGLHVDEPGLPPVLQGTPIFSRSPSSGHAKDEISDTDHVTSLSALPSSLESHQIQPASRGRSKPPEQRQPARPEVNHARKAFKKRRRVKRVLFSRRSHRPRPRSQASEAESAVTSQIPPSLTPQPVQKTPGKVSPVALFRTPQPIVRCGTVRSSSPRRLHDRDDSLGEYESSEDELCTPGK